MLTLESHIFNPVSENTYLVYNEKREALIIDPGCYFPEERQQLKSRIEALALRPLLLINTHCHLDHVFGNRFVYETWGLELHFHALEQKVFDFAPQAGAAWNLPFDPYEGPVHHLSENEPILCGEEQIQLLLTPGHSPGSISLYYPRGKWVIAGDVLFRESVGRTDLPGSDFTTLANSIRTELYALPDETLVYPGHGTTTTIGHEKQHNPFVKP